MSLFFVILKSKQCNFYMNKIDQKSVDCKLKPVDQLLMIQEIRSHLHIKFLFYHLHWCSGIVMGFRVKGLEFKLCRNTTGIHQEGHLEFKVLHCSSTKSGSKASV